jgi:hypothetical protein
MKQKFNVGLAVRYGVRSAVIIEIMIDFCRSAKNSVEYKHNDRVYVPYSEISRKLHYMNEIQFKAALQNLINHNIIQVANFSYGVRYTFTDYAKEQFSKKPIRIRIDWQ